jgi:RNA polymerase sigma-70 factor, ECF subfamily
MDMAESHPNAKPSAAVPDVAGTEAFVRLLIRHQADLFRYIYSLLPHQEDARDALQETCVALFRKFSAYDPAKPFLAWAYGFAYLEVMKQRERTAKSGRHLREELFELLARERQQQDADLHSRLGALEHCLSELPAADRQLMHDRYSANCPIEDLVERHATSRRTLFRNLDRIRRQLMKCISRRLSVATT